MKRTVSLLLMIAVLLSLTGCFVNVNKSFDLTKTAGDIRSIEIYNLVDEWYQGNDISEEYEPVDTVDESRFEEFVGELKGVRFTDTIILIPAAVDPNFSYYGYVVKVCLDDGGYYMLSAAGVQYKYSVNGRSSMYHYDCDDDIWAGFVEKYMD